MVWEKCTIETSEGKKQGIAPLIISASRSTDIPAFYSDWFINRLRKGYSKWINPFNRREQYISFSRAKFAVFWSKNPKPMLKHLQEINKHKIKYYFQFTLNDYEREGLEPNVPSLKERLDTFKELSSKIGKERVIWRFDPLIMIDGLDLDQLIDKIERIGNELYKFTEKLVFSYVDISSYTKVKHNFQRIGIKYFEFNPETMIEAAEKIIKLNKKWEIEICTCAEKIPLEKYGIKHNKCIDDELILRISPNDTELKRFLGYNRPHQTEMFLERNPANSSLKDKGQRLECGCIVSKDIGQYNTCGHLCTYCYANHSSKIVHRNLNFADSESASILNVPSHNSSI